MIAPDVVADVRHPLRLATFDTVAEGLDYAGLGQAGCTFFSSRGEPTCTLGYSEIREQSLALAHRLVAQRLKRFARVAIIGETGPDFLVAFFACHYAGMLPVPLPIDVSFGGLEAYTRRLRAMLHAADVSLAIGPVELLPILAKAAEPLVCMVATVGDLQTLSPGGSTLRPLGPEEPCYVQYSSGSTRKPRGVLITQRSLLHNAHAIARYGLALRPGDCGTSWLPLYHDMGLVGFCLTTMLCQIPVHYLSPTAFARRPQVWLKILSEYGGTISFSPTAGYELCERSARNGAGRRLDLRHWRIAGVGGDMLRPDVLDRFVERFAPYGFSASAFVPSYGLAESTLAVSFGPLGMGVRWDMVNLDALELSGHAVPARLTDGLSPEKVRPFAICGRPLPGHDIAIRDDNGTTLPDRQVGRVWIKGPSVMSGYFDDPAVLSAAPPSDRWLDTGDLGYSRGGELVIAGRSKDLIIWNGRNIWPQDLEWAVGEVQGIRSGAVAAFAIDGGKRGEEIVVIAECRSMDARFWPELRRAITMTLHRTAGVVCRLVLAPPHSLPFTSSGKLSRAAAQTLYLQGTIKDVADGSSMA